MVVNRLLISDSDQKDADIGQSFPCPEPFLLYLIYHVFFGLYTLKIEKLRKSFPTITAAKAAVHQERRFCSGRTKKFNREIRIAMGHMQTMTYIADIMI